MNKDVIFLVFSRVTDAVMVVFTHVPLPIAHGLNHSLEHSEDPLETKRFLSSSIQLESEISIE